MNIDQDSDLEITSTIFPNDKSKNPAPPKAQTNCVCELLRYYEYPQEHPIEVSSISNLMKPPQYNSLISGASRLEVVSSTTKIRDFAESVSQEL